MLSVGFDPSFIDTLVRVESKDRIPIDTLPQLGHHHRHNSISRIAGGNGVNISAILSTLKLEHNLVVPSNAEFDILLKKRGIRNIVPIHDRVNESVGITLKSGELQFNDGRHGLDYSDWDEKVHKFWIKSPLAVFTNWGLNPTSAEWVSCQWLASCGFSHRDISNCKDVRAVALKTEGCSSNLLIEPGSITNHQERDFLNKLLRHIAHTTEGNMFSIFAANEEEFSEFNSLKFKQFILHTSKEVILEEKSVKTTFAVDPLNCTPFTFVGAGDAFMAGLIVGLCNNTMDIEFAINTAQNFLCSRL